MIEGINPQPAQNLAGFDPTARQQEEKKLREAAKGFEQVFMTQLLAEMHKTVGKCDLFGEGKEEEQFQSMLDQERAKAWSDSGGVGLASLIYEQMKSQLSSKPQDVLGGAPSMGNNPPSTSPTADKPNGPEVVPPS